MVSLRLMDDDPDEVRRVADLLFPLIASADGLVVGGRREVPNRRGAGLRIFTEVIAPPDDQADDERKP